MKLSRSSILVRNSSYYQDPDKMNQSISDIFSSNTLNSTLVLVTSVTILLIIIVFILLRIVCPRLSGKFGLGTRSVAESAINRDSNALKYFSDEIKDDKKLVLKAVKFHGLALQHASERLRNDKQVVMKAVKQNGLALQYASEDLKLDYDVVLRAVNQNGIAIRFAAPDFQAFGPWEI